MTKQKKAHSKSKQSYKFKQELNIHQNEENDTNTSTKQAKDIKKTAKTEGLKQIKQNWENIPLKESTHCKVKKFMQIKETPISGYVVQV